MSEETARYGIDKKLEDIIASVAVGDLVPFLRRTFEGNDTYWLVNGRVVEKLPFLMKVAYTFDGHQEVGVQSYADFYCLSRGNSGLGRKVTTAPGYNYDWRHHDQLSPDQMMKALTTPVSKFGG